MSGPTVQGSLRPAGGVDWIVVLGYAVGVGIAFVATVGLFLQYGSSSLNAATGGLLSFVLGALLGGLWAWLPISGIGRSQRR